MKTINPQGEVWVFAEQHGASLCELDYELCGKARKLADALGVKVGAVLIGDESVACLADALVAYGADRVYLVANPKLKNYTTMPYAHAIRALIEKYEPQIVLYGASATGRDVAPRVAAALETGLTADCISLEIGDYQDPKTGKEYKNILQLRRPSFGGHMLATIVAPDHAPQMATVREGVFPAPEWDDDRKGETIKEEIAFDDSLFAVEVLDRIERESGVNLKNAKIIVGGGAGVGSRENFKLIYDLAAALGGTVGATRAATQSGYIEEERMIGQTGTIVRPDLYVAVGISGAVEHRVGIQDAGKIVAINSDPKAPIFSIAHYGIVGDLNDVVPKLIKALQERA